MPRTYTRYDVLEEERGELVKDGKAIVRRRDAVRLARRAARGRRCAVVVIAYDPWSDQRRLVYRATYSEGRGYGGTVRGADLDEAWQGSGSSTEA